MTDGVARSPSVKDVAALAGVAVGTVSNVLNRPERVSDPTRRRVHDAMTALGFVRNESARQLRAGSSRVLAYVMLDAGNPFFTDVARGVEDIAEESGLSLFLCDTHQDVQRERAYLARLKQLRVQGVLLTPVEPDRTALNGPTVQGVPIVLIDRIGSDPKNCSVSVDNVQGGTLALAHLLDQGHTRIGFAGGPDRIGQVRDRLRGARDVLTSAGFDPETLTVFGTEALTVSEGRTVGARLAGLASAVRPTALFCANDLLALGLLQRCVELGIRVPDDVAIVGYDDIEFAAAAAVPLTSVRQPRRELGRTAAQLLIDEATNPDHEHRHVTLMPELIARASSVVPRAGLVTPS